MTNDQHQRVGSTAPSMDVRWLRPGVASVTLGGEHDLSSADRLSDVLTQTLASCTHLVVDVSSTEFIDSSTIRVLVSTKGRANATSRRFNQLLGTEPIVERVLEITGVLTALNCVYTIEEAVGEPRQSTRRPRTAAA